MDKLNPAYLYLFFTGRNLTDMLAFILREVQQSYSRGMICVMWNNKHSHLCGVFERGATPVEVPEMKKTVNLIIDKLKSDKDQFSSLLKSIGIELKEEKV